MEATLRQQAERYLGTEIGPSEWGEARVYAERKLAGIIEREGDTDGARRELWYLAQLIAEIVRGSRLSRYTRSMWERERPAGEEMGIKKDGPRQTARTIS